MKKLFSIQEVRKLYSKDYDEDKYNRWKELINMSSGELKKFMDSDEGKAAGLTKEQADDAGIKSGQESARWILKMLAKKPEDWTPKMWEWCGRQIGFISRMKGNKGPLRDENGNRTRKTTSLMIWGHNPEK